MRMERVTLQWEGRTSVICIGARPPINELLGGAAPTSILVVCDLALSPAFLAGVGQWAAAAGVPASTLHVRGGEALKQVAGWRDVLMSCDRARLDRRSLLIAVGGGSVGDVAGFAAATWHRGIDWIGVPTSLVGMVDALIGGKTAINFAGGKNSVGSFHLPRAVVIETAALQGLPAPELKSGWGEVLKTAIIGDVALFEDFATGRRGPRTPGEPSAETVARCARVKCAVVEKDFRESGARMVLNLGHTLAHALESHAGTGGIAHGMAVAKGISFAAQIALDVGIVPLEIAHRIDGVLRAWGFDRRWDPRAADALLAEMMRDKKSIGGVLHMALPRAIGDIVVAPVPVAAVTERLKKGTRFE